MILFILKLTYGLDGFIEHSLSERARKLNRERDEENQLFVLDDWIKYSKVRAVTAIRHSMFAGERFREMFPAFDQSDSLKLRKIVRQEQSSDSLETLPGSLMKKKFVQIEEEVVARTG